MTSSQRPLAIRVRSLRRHYGRFPALRDVTFDVPCGQLVALIGHNGAGKTTLLRTIATLDRPTAGQVQVMGHDVVRATMAVRRRIGLVAHRTLLYPDLTAEENLRFYGRMYGLDLPEEEVARRLDAVGLLPVRRARVRALSHGTARRLAIARATLHDPPLLLLDEPYAGLDPRAAATLDATLKDLAARGHTVVVTTHNVDRARDLADATLELERGCVGGEEEGPGEGRPGG
ncbi:MAG: heme ABC exporter ATP-binding protein CcmA, partial [Anaerolineae bacterium]